MRRNGVPLTYFLCGFTILALFWTFRFFRTWFSGNGLLNILDNRFCGFLYCSCKPITSIIAFTTTWRQFKDWLLIIFLLFIFLLLLLLMLILLLRWRLLLLILLWLLISLFGCIIFPRAPSISTIRILVDRSPRFYYFRSWSWSWITRGSICLSRWWIIT